VKACGSVTTVWRNFERAARTGGSVEVPCGGCTACCTSPESAPELSRREAARLEHTTDAKGRLRLKRKSDGSCVYLVDSKCSIHPNRPVVCQQFDCRVFLLLGCGTSDRMVQEALRQWESPSIKTAEDRATLTSLRLAVKGDSTMPPARNEIEALHRAMNWRSYLPVAKAALRRGR
jgi:Fe-S-cluster containining protein